MLESFQRATFAERIGETFELRLEGAEPLQLALIEASGLSGDSDQRESFSLLFRGPGEPVLAQSIYPLRHGELGDFDLFLVPVGPDRKAGGMLYEAVFT